MNWISQSPANLRRSSISGVPAFVAAHNPIQRGRFDFMLAYGTQFLNDGTSFTQSIYRSTPDSDLHHSVKPCCRFQNHNRRRSDRPSQKAPIPRVSRHPLLVFPRFLQPAMFGLSPSKAFEFKIKKAVASKISVVLILALCVLRCYKKRSFSETRQEIDRTYKVCIPNAIKTVAVGQKE